MARRTLLSRLMLASAAVAAAVPAAAEPQTSAQESPMLDRLIADFTMAAIRLNAMDLEGDPEAYSEASKVRSAALVALAFHQPQTVMELSAKLAALVEFTEDTERFALRIMVEDTARLGEVQ